MGPEIHDGSMNDLILSDTLENMTKTWPSKTLRAVIFGYEIHVVELQAYVRVQEYGHTVKFFSFDSIQYVSPHMIALKNFVFFQIRVNFD